MASNEERVTRLKARLTPAVREAIERAVKQDRLPAPLKPVVATQAARSLGLGPPREPETLSPPAGTRRTEAPAIEIPTAPLAGIEAIVQRFGRPPLLVQDDKVVLEELRDFPAETDKLIQGIEGRIPAVGRIEFLNYAMAWGGTGWVVQESRGGRLVVTNRHVAALVARRKSDGRAIFMRGPSGASYGARINFREGAQGSDRSRTARLSAVEYLADDAAADVALLRIEAAGFELPAPVELDETPVKINDLVAVIGYPAYDSRNDAEDQARYFRDLYEVKRLAPGYVTQEAAADAILAHDCTTLGGSSGSAVIGLATGKAVGLHFAGVYGKNNSAVTAATLAALLRGERPVAGRLFEAREERADGHHPAEHFKDRTGFDPTHLGHELTTPWPGLPEQVAKDLAAPSDRPGEPGELRYTHFGVKYSARLKAPVMTAVNLDGERAVRIKRGADQWFTDGRIAREIQLGSANFADPLIDRGHMVRREDPNWGDREEALRANDDTFHYVNAATQHSTLNQGKTLWQGLENYILDSVRSEEFKASVFTGPVFRDEEEEEEIVIDGALVPLEFWKVVVMADPDGKGLHATAYLLSQGELIRKLLTKRSRREGLEGFTFGGYRTFQLAIADLAAATGYDFSAYAEADPLAKSKAGKEALGTGEPVVLPLETLEDIRL